MDELFNRTSEPYATLTEEEAAAVKEHKYPSLKVMNTAGIALLVIIIVALAGHIIVLNSATQCSKIKDGDSESLVSDCQCNGDIENDNEGECLSTMGGRTWCYVDFPSGCKDVKVWNGEIGFNKTYSFQACKHSSKSSRTIGATSICKTDRAKQVEQPCIFPFYYKDILFQQCSNMDHHTLWCPTKVDTDGKYVKGHWGNCNIHCPISPTSDWTKSHTSCYKFLTDICRMGCTDKEAVGLCQAEGGRLAEPRTDKALANLTSLAAGMFPGYAWIVGIHRGGEGVFLWDSDGSRVDLKKLKPRKDGDKEKGCVELEVGGKLNYVPCDIPIGMALCQKDKC